MNIKKWDSHKRYRLPKRISLWFPIDFDDKIHFTTCISFQIIECLFNTVSDKRITIFGFAFKKNTGDTRETPAITVCKTLLEEGAKLNIYDPKVDHQQILEDLTHPCVTDSPEYVRKAIDIFDNAYDAVKDTYAIVLCTEWDEFVVRMILFGIFHYKCYKANSMDFIISFLSFSHSLSHLQELDYRAIYSKMMKPAYIFDGRKILKHKELQDIGFHVQTIGRKLNRTGLLRSWATQQ